MSAHLNDSFVENYIQVLVPIMANEIKRIIFPIQYMKILYQIPKLKHHGINKLSKCSHSQIHEHIIFNIQKQLKTSLILI